MDFDVEKLTEQAENGDVEAMKKVAALYYRGESGVPQDYEKAFFWFQRAAEKEDAGAQCVVAMLYQIGRGTENDFEKALYWMEKADENGEEDAREKIEGLKELSELQKQANQGDGTACAALAEKLMAFGVEQGQNGQKLFQKSLAYARKAEEENVPQAFWVLALAYEKGRGVPVDTDKAIDYYEKGAKLEDAGCQDSLGCYYLRGDHLEKDKQKGFELIRSAAEQGYGLGMKHLGNCYQFGWGCMGNMKTSLEWYRKASEVLDDPELQMRVMIFETMADADPDWDQDFEGEEDDE